MWKLKGGPVEHVGVGRQTVSEKISSASPQSSSSMARERPAAPGPAGLVAISATLLAIPGILGVSSAFAYIWIVRPNLKSDSMLLLLLGAAVLSVGFFSVTGLFAGMIEAIQSRQRKGIASLAIVVNAAVLLAIAFLMVIGWLAG